MASISVRKQAKWLLAGGTAESKKRGNEVENITILVKFFDGKIVSPYVFQPSKTIVDIMIGSR